MEDLSKGQQLLTELRKDDAAKTHSSILAFFFKKKNGVSTSVWLCIELTLDVDQVLLDLCTQIKKT